MRRVMFLVTLLSASSITVECAADEMPVLTLSIAAQDPQDLPETRDRLFASQDTLGFSVITRTPPTTEPTAAGFGDILETMQPEWKTRRRRQLPLGYALPPRDKFSRWILVR